MLYIYIDNCRKELPEGYISYVSDYFNDVYEPEWFSDEFVKDIIKQIEKSEVVGEDRSVNIYNEYLGNIPPDRLSSGCKSLILLYKEDVKINGDRLGDNCIELLLKIAGKKDVTISLSHTPPFPEKFEAVVLNSGRHIGSSGEYLSEKIRWMYK